MLLNLVFQHFIAFLFSVIFFHIFHYFYILVWIVKYIPLIFQQPWLYRPCSWLFKVCILQMLELIFYRVFQFKNLQNFLTSFTSIYDFQSTSSICCFFLFLQDFVTSTSTWWDGEILHILIFLIPAVQQRFSSYFIQ